MRSRILLLLFLVVAVHNLSAQSIKEMRLDPADFLGDFTKNYTGLKGGKKLAEPQLAPFQAVWNSFAFTEEQQVHLAEVANVLVKKRTTDPLVWESYMQCILGLASGMTEEFVSAWSKHSLEVLRKASLKEVTVHFETWNHVFHNGILFSDGQITWRWQGGSSSMEHDPFPQLILDGVKMIGRYKEDSIVLEGVSGLYNPSTGTLHASAGLAHWQRAGFSPDEMYVDLGSFVLEANKPGFVADSAVIHSQHYILTPEKGRFEDRLTARNEEERAIFPRFEAYSRLHLPDFFPKVDYEGGFSIVGRKFFASARDGEKAQFLFYYDEKPALKLRAKRFLITPEGMSSEESTVSFLLGPTDSLYHQKSSVRYHPTTGDFSAKRPQEGLALIPYTDTYHALDVYLDKIEWNTSEPVFYLGTLNLGTPTPMILESRQYFRGERFSRLQGLSSKNPLVQIERIGTAFGNQLSLADMASALSMSVPACDIFMMELALQGFVRYSPDTRWIEVQPKTQEYILNNVGRRDYDVIRFVSEVAEGMNAKISFLNNEMELVGIQNLTVSDSQKVALFPVNQRILVKKGLDFDFNGTIKAGRFAFYGRKFSFSYAPFELNMPTIDSMKFMVESFDAESDGRKRMVLVKNTLQDINGRLEIDHPLNKSSRKRYTHYPIFNSGKRCYVYYDKPSTYDGIYKRSRFHVEISPFTIDSLDNTSTQGLRFDGMLTSAGIFPVTRQSIGVQRDYSLGFSTQTPPEGWSAYAGKGLVKGRVSLSNNGLEAKGELVYVRSVSTSSQWVLFPDSTRGAAENMHLTALSGSTITGHPDASCQGAWVQWQPYAGRLLVTSKATPLSIYSTHKGTATGRLAYAPDKLSLRGVAGMFHSELESQDLSLFALGYKSPSATFRVRATEIGTWGFVMPTATAQVDLTTKKGQFVSIYGASWVEFPINQYKSSMDRAYWDISAQAVALARGTSGATAEMVSLHRHQDSLRFMAEKAIFFLLPSVLKGRGVPYIDVADARIYPDSGKVVIDPVAVIRPLVRAKMVADRNHQYHRLENGELRISGRNSFGGTATYLYKDAVGKIKPILFSRIQSDSGETTYGRGELSESSPFALSPQFSFYGVVKMYSTKEHLLFEGFTSITAVCPAVVSGWFKTASYVNPKEIVLELPSRDSAKGIERVYNGIFIAQDSVRPYAAFVGRTGASSAVELLTAYGILFYEPDKRRYVVTTRRRKEDMEAPDNWIALYTESCIVEGVGQLQLGKNMGLASLEAYGQMKADLRQKTIKASVAMKANFLFNEEVLKGLKTELSLLPKGDMYGDPAAEMANHLLSPREKQSYYGIGLQGKLPKEFKSTLFFEKVDVMWDPSAHAFRSQGPVMIGGIEGEAIHAEVDGILEIRKKNRGDEMAFYLNNGNEHFFHYKRNNLQFYSTHKPYMEAILSLPPDKRSIAPKNGQPPYMYNSSSKGRMKLFLENQPLVDEASSEKKEGESLDSLGETP